MSEVYRRLSPKKIRTNDLLMVRGRLEVVYGVEIYPPVQRAPDRARPALCPVREDWWAVGVHTESGATEWLSEPDLPGPR